MSEQKPEPKDEVTDEIIAKRAYEISQSEEAGTPEENWERAKRELGEAPRETPSPE